MSARGYSLMWDDMGSDAKRKAAMHAWPGLGIVRCSVRSFIDAPGAFRRAGLAVEAQVVDRECPEVVRRGLAPRRPGAGGRKR